jgi:uncharacterized protein YjiS (DUF1127 family)
MNSLAENARDSVLNRLTARLNEWRRWRAERRELKGLGCATATRLLADCGLTLDDLDHMTNPKAATLLPKMRKLVGVGDDARALSCRHDMERTCGGCEQWRRCEAALAVGTAIETYHEFCANAATLDALTSPSPTATTTNKD